MNFLKKNWFVTLSEQTRGSTYKEHKFLIRGWSAWSVFPEIIETCKQKEAETNTKWCIMDMKRV